MTPHPFDIALYILAGIGVYCVLKYLYQATTQFVIGDDENVLDAIDKWLKETVREYEHPSHQFDVKQVITIRTTNDRERS